MTIRSHQMYKPLRTIKEADFPGEYIRTVINVCLEDYHKTVQFNSCTACVHIFKVFKFEVFAVNWLSLKIYPQNFIGSVCVSC